MGKTVPSTASDAPSTVVSADFFFRLPNPNKVAMPFFLRAPIDEAITGGVLF
jgi:hypothetical protein